MKSRVIALGSLAIATAACSRTEREPNDMAGGILPAGVVTTGGGPVGSGDPRLDVGSGAETAGVPGCANPDSPACQECELGAMHVPCDDNTNDPFTALGVGCPGEAEVQTSAEGPAQAITVRSSYGATDTFDPREGAAYAVIGSGRVDELARAPAGWGPQEASDPSFCNDDLDGLGDEAAGPSDPGMLPAPLQARAVAGDCAGDPGLAGTGDCSGTLQAQLAQGTAVYDYVALTIDAVVPPGAQSLDFDFAFLTTEYPFYVGSEYNDIFVGWLESERWTGNISFDDGGNPISLNAAFFDIRDDGGNQPELQGTCMSGHGATRWLSSTAPVTAGEEIRVVFAVFDLSDNILDSYVFLDNWRWGCTFVEQPDTKPVG